MIDLINILVARRADSADMSKVVSAIDEMVASRELYGLSEDEVRIVEGK